ncbi:MAG: tyrosine-type recombinase/integrase [Gallionella sp.]|nr:tyrosine-type recombinase/integrase [Gallionella sp.]MDD5612084.1 tyrosine-type recombinase/integrase [Gallionella sp.]
MAIITLSEALLKKLSATDSRILRDRILCGFCLKANKRSRTFLVATSVRGQQFRMTLGYWPLMSVEEARTLAMTVLRDCRSGQMPVRKPTNYPTVRQALKAYCEAKGLQQSSRTRYDSLGRTHFADWLDQPVTVLADKAFSEHCHRFAQSNGAAIVELGRGVVGALLKYLNAVHGLKLDSPFNKLAAAGLLPERAKPRERLLRESGLPAWKYAVDKLPELQRDYLMLLLLTGLRRDEGHELRPKDIDFDSGILTIPKTKNGKIHTLPLTATIRAILLRRCNGLEPEQQLFAGVARDHVHKMVMRLGAPRFMLHDLRKMLATTGEKLSLSDTTMRRILNHTAPKSDVLHKHYVSLEVSDIAEPLHQIEEALIRLMQPSIKQI